MKFQASVHGINLDGEEAEQSQSSSKPVKKKGMMFGAPEDYAHMTPEERQAETDRMMGFWKAWDQVKKPMGGNVPKELSPREK